MDKVFYSVKEKELYEVLIDKLHHYFVEEKKEAKMDSVIMLLSVIAPYKADKDKAAELESKNFEEVDIL